MAIRLGTRVSKRQLNQGPRRQLSVLCHYLSPRDYATGPPPFATFSGPTQHRKRKTDGDLVTE